MSTSVDVAGADFGALHALRIKGAATIDDVARIAGATPSDVDRSLQAAENGGLVVRRAAAGTDYLALTDDGRAAVTDALEQRVGGSTRTDLGAHYDARFLPVNVRFKRLCADWQIEQRFEYVEDAVDVHDQLSAFLADAVRADERFAVYTSRLDAAMDRFQSGDEAALAAPIGDSYHNVWFELHEDLILTLGRSRADEEQ